VNLTAVACLFTTMVAQASGERTRLACIVWRLAGRTKVRWRYRDPPMRATVFAARRRKQHARRVRSADWSLARHPTSRTTRSAQLPAIQPGSL